MEIIWSNYIIFETWSNFKLLSRLSMSVVSTSDIFLDTDNLHWQILHADPVQSVQRVGWMFFICRTSIGYKIRFEHMYFNKFRIHLIKKAFPSFKSTSTLKVKASSIINVTKILNNELESTKIDSVRIWLAQHMWFNFSLFSNKSKCWRMCICIHNFGFQSALTSINMGILAWFLCCSHLYKWFEELQFKQCSQQ